MKTHEIIDALKSSGQRITKAREAIVDIFTITRAPLTAQAILALLENKGVIVNKTTIYRELEFLLNAKIIHQVRLHNTTVFYELLRHDDHHHHVICESCGKIEDIDIEDEQKLIDAIQKKSTYKINSHSLEFFGICKNCQKL